MDGFAIGLALRIIALVVLNGCASPGNSPAYWGVLSSVTGSTMNGH